MRASVASVNTSASFTSGTTQRGARAGTRTALALVKSLTSVSAFILVVAREGRRPSAHQAAEPRPLFQYQLHNLCAHADRAAGVEAGLLLNRQRVDFCAR